MAPEAPRRAPVGRIVPRAGAPGDGVERRGLEPTSPFTDFYHLLIQTSWPRLFAFFVATYLVVNSGFAALYLAGGDCISNAEPGSFRDAFFFSVQTMATIGYGVLAPKTSWAHTLVTIEALTGMLGIAMSTGLMFAKFARTRARVMFSNVAVISTRNGVPTLVLRVANQRKSTVAEAQLRLTIVRWEQTAEGELMRRFHDLDLARSSTPVFVLSWTVMHTIDAKSPLAGVTPESLAYDMVEVVASFSGVDEVSGQTVHARFSWTPEDIKFNARLLDIFVRPVDGSQGHVDFRRFHDWEAEPEAKRATPPSGGGGGGASASA